MENYDVIFLVYPLWCNTLPMPVEGFLKQYDLTGKTPIPIVTHGGSGIGESLKAIHKATNFTKKGSLCFNPKLYQFIKLLSKSDLFNIFSQDGL